MSKYTTPHDDRPNLDAINENERLCDLAASIPLDAPPGMIRYAFRKRCAVRARLAGDIRTARRHEQRCDAIYSALPRGWRW